MKMDEYTDLDDGEPISRGDRIFIVGFYLVIATFLIIGGVVGFVIRIRFMH
jgi:hypothetical protein